MLRLHSFGYKGVEKRKTNSGANHLLTETAALKSEPPDQVREHLRVLPWTIFGEEAYLN
jgi:hypothetical protein